MVLNILKNLLTQGEEVVAKMVDLNRCYSTTEQTVRRKTVTLTCEENSGHVWHHRNGNVYWK